MSTLTDEIKAFIVKGLAQYDTPSEVAEAVKVNFGVEVSRQQVHTYDPTGSQPPASRWRDLHAATRQAFLRETAEIGIAHKSFRLKLLDRMAHHAMKYNNLERVAGLLEQAAKECGGVYDRGKAVVPVAAKQPDNFEVGGTRDQRNARTSERSPE